MACGLPKASVDSHNLCRYPLLPLPPSILSYVQYSLTFKVGKDPVPKFRMIEHHFALGKVMKTVDFTFDFCIPNTTNNWEQIYEMPELSEEEVATITKDKMCADSFYFVNDEMVMHNKAYMSYRE